MASRSYCKADLIYADPASGEQRPVETVILDGRAGEPGNWQEAGFQLLNFPSAVNDWSDDGQVERLHYPEVRTQASELTGADFVMLDSHIRRGPAQKAQHEDLGPIHFVHSDFAPSYNKLIRDIYAGDELDAARREAGITARDVQEAKRLVIVQFWRNLGPVHMDAPIAFCDTRSVDTQAAIPIMVSNYAGGGTDFEALAIAAPADDAQPAWYTYPDMNCDEAVVFRTFDSELTGDDHFWTPHAAFRDPGVAAGKPARESIELRAACFFR